MVGFNDGKFTGWGSVDNHKFAFRAKFERLKMKLEDSPGEIWGKEVGKH